MKEAISVAEATTSAKQVLVPDRYQQPFVDAYQSLTGLEVPDLTGREMKARSKGILYRSLRGRDVPLMTTWAMSVEPDLPTIGLTGSEWCAEYACSTSPLSPTITWDRLAEVRLGCVALIARANSDTADIKNRLKTGFEPIGVVTAYPNLVGALGVSGQFNIACRVAVQGSVEGNADMLGIPGVDLVSTGKTLAANRFVVVAELLDSYPAIVTACPQAERA